MYRQISEYNIPCTGLIVDDEAWPSPALGGVTCTEEKIWSADTGRLEDNAEMVGTLVTIKNTYSFKWAALPLKDVAFIRSRISSLTPWHKIEVLGPDYERIEFTAYWGNPSYSLYSWRPGLPRAREIACKAVEK